MRSLVAVVTLLVIVIGFMMYHSSQLQEQITQLGHELDALNAAQIVQDTIVAYFAEAWPDLHVMRVESKPEQPGVLSVHALASGEVLVIKCRFTPEGIDHDLGQVLRDKVGSLRFSLTTLLTEPGGQEIVELHSPAGMRVQFQDVVGKWALVNVQEKQGYVPLWLISLRQPAFYMRPIAQLGHNPVDIRGLTPDAALEIYFAAFARGDFRSVVNMHSQSLYVSQEEFLTMLMQEKEDGYRIWGYEVLEYEMITAHQAAVLVSYTFDTHLDRRTSTVSEWWRIIRENGAWRIAWMAKKY